MTHSIVPIVQQHIEGFRAALDSVAREHKYLAYLEAPPLEDVRKFVLESIRCRRRSTAASWASA